MTVTPKDSAWWLSDESSFAISRIVGSRTHFLTSLFRFPHDGIHAGNSNYNLRFHVSRSGSPGSEDSLKASILGEVHNGLLVMVLCTQTVVSCRIAIQVIN